MKKYTIEELKNEFARLGYKWFDYQFIGIRSKANLPNVFDDLFILVNGNELKYYTCTTNAGTHWLKNLLNPKGTSLLKPNQYINGWKLGLHQGKYEAFIQNAPVAVYRDSDLDEIAEEAATIDVGYFGINIHRANDKWMSKLIDKWSAGCQVLSNPVEFSELLKKSKDTGKTIFTYTLVNEF